jgi:NAD-dependent dihydropyrimidine dehydrogenase PreA subunit
MIDIFREDCFGCTACASVCPKNAISFEKDKLGFLYPIIDNDRCIECNLCEKICPVQTYNSLLNPKPKNVYAARHISLDEVKSSRSGAAFIAFSDVVLKKGGTVYGASLDDEFNVKHIKTTCSNDRDRLRGSKYVQSDLRGIIYEIKKDLESGLYVLFSGTPCQVAGVEAAIPQKLKERLFSLDILCHGVPSPSLWKDYVHYQEEHHSARITKFEFRDKSINGWSDHIESMTFDNEQHFTDKLYTNLFYTNSFFRKCCYKCPFATTSRVGDITLADFWGWEKVNKDINKDNRGISLLLINSSKGEALFEEAQSCLNTLSVDIADCMQRNLEIPTPAPDFREEYVSYYVRNGFHRLVKYLYNPSIAQRLVRKIKRIYYKWI